MKKINLVLLFLILAGISSVYAQQAFTLIQQESTLKIKGTSSIHDWEMLATDFTAEVVPKKNGQGLEGFENANLQVLSKKIVSDNSTMDNKAHDALKAKTNPEIRFKMISYKLNNLSSRDFQGTVTGSLTIAGITKTVSIPIKGQSPDMNSFSVSGAKDLKMSDFGMEPPKAMLGALKTGDEIVIEFDLKFKTNPEASLGK